MFRVYVFCPLFSNFWSANIISNGFYCSRFWESNTSKCVTLLINDFKNGTCSSMLTGYMSADLWNGIRYLIFCDWNTWSGRLVFWHKNVKKLKFVQYRILLSTTGYECEVLFFFLIFFYLLFSFDINGLYLIKTFLLFIATVATGYPRKWRFVLL